MHASGGTPLVVINQVSPILVRFAIPATQLPLLQRYGQAGGLAVVATPESGSGRVGRSRSAAGRRLNVGGTIAARPSRTDRRAPARRPVDAERRHRRSSRRWSARRTASCRSSTTRSTPRPAPCSSRRRSPTRIGGSGPASSRRLAASVRRGERARRAAAGGRHGPDRLVRLCRRSDAARRASGR